MARQYSRLFCWLMNLVDSRVHDDADGWCRWVAPYGFVIDAGCSRHD